MKKEGNEFQWCCLKLPFKCAFLKNAFIYELNIFRHQNMVSYLLHAPNLMTGNVQLTRGALVMKSLLKESTLSAHRNLEEKFWCFDWNSTTLKHHYCGVWLLAGVVNKQLSDWALFGAKWSRLETMPTALGCANITYNGLKLIQGDFLVHIFIHN